MRGTEVLDDERVSPLGKLLFVALCKYANKDNQCYPSIRTLMKITGTTNQTVQRKLKELIECGWVIKGKGQKKSNLYQLTYPQLENSGVMMSSTVDKLGNLGVMMSSTGCTDGQYSTVLMSSTELNIINYTNNNNGNEVNSQPVDNFTELEKYGISAKQIEFWQKQYSEKGGIEYIMAKFADMKRQIMKIDSPIKWMQSALANDYKTIPLFTKAAKPDCNICHGTGREPRIDTLTGQHVSIPCKCVK